MEGKRVIQEIALENFLSFGEEQRIPLEPLNVLIGPNGSGKSNVLEAFALLQAAPINLSRPISAGGGVSEWLWKGGKEPLPAQVEVVVSDPRDAEVPMRYSLSFRREGYRFELDAESIAADKVGRNVFYYRYRGGDPPTGSVPSFVSDENGRRITGTTDLAGIKPSESILSQRKDPLHFPEITYLGQLFSEIAIYWGWDYSDDGALKGSQRVDQPQDRLRGGGSNLALIVNDLEHRGAGPALLDELRRFSPMLEQITTKIQEGTVQVYAHERGLREPIPATRLSDGLLSYLCLLTILCHPEPPPLVCIDEPELGMHPDAIHRIGELLIEASQRTQLVVTTHSTELVAALSDFPEAVVVCERDEGGTRLRRLEREPLKEWLEKYTLGDLWAMGEIGGTR
jgi:predicted ATPase